MSMDYFIDITLDAQFDELSISKVLIRGRENGFTYYDHIICKRYDDSPILTPTQAATKIVAALRNKIEDGPTVYTNIGDTTVFISFYKNRRWLFGIAYWWFWCT